MYLLACIRGGWVVAKASHTHKDILCGVIPHPSLTLEETVFKGKAVDLVKQIQCPIMWMPAGNDPDRYRDKPEGDLYHALKHLHAQSAVVDFPDMTHGWVPRGDLSDERVREGVQRALDHTVAYLTRFLH